MAKICDAVQHAHQRGLIHRDLKPSNTLVEESGQPRVLDFGVARLTDSDAHATRQTDVGQLVGTLAYMSPEQVLGDSEEIDTRSDVYALGVILYELLAGQKPYAIGRQLPEVVRTIREEEPTSLSSVNRAYRGDIETIAGKALEKDKTRRYGSAAELAADLRRHLHDEPITARPPSTMYQLQKFARRNKVLVIGVAVVFVVLVAGVVASTWEAVQARRAEASAQAVNDFVRKDLLAQASPDNQVGPGYEPDPDLKVRTVLDRAAQRITGKFDQQPEVEAAIRETIGSSYLDLGLKQQAIPQLREVLALDLRNLGEKNPKTIAAMSSLGMALGGGLVGRDDSGVLKADQVDEAEAERLLTRSFEISRRTLGPQHAITLACTTNLGWFYLGQNKFAQAEALAIQVVDVRRRALGRENRATLSSMQSLAEVYWFERKYQQDEALAKETLDIRRRVLGPGDPATLGSADDLAGAYHEEGKYQEAEALYRETIENERSLGPDNPQTVRTMWNLAYIYDDQHKYAEAEPLVSEIVDVRRRVYGADNPLTLGAISYLASLHAKEHKYAEAEALYRKALESAPNDAGRISYLASVYKEDKYAEAEGLYRKSLESAPNDAYRLNALAWYLVAVPDRSRRRPEEALPLARRAVKAAPEVATDYNTLGLAEVRNGLWDEAIAALNKSAEMDKGSDPTDFFFLAVAHWNRGDKTEGEQFFQRGVDGARKDVAKQPEWRLFSAEAAKLLGKPGPPARAGKG